MLQQIVRVVCAAIALFVLANVLAGLLVPALDSSIWIIDLRWMPRACAVGLAAVACTPILISIAGRPRFDRPAAVSCAALALIAALDSIRFYWLLGEGHIASSLPIPASLLYCVVLIAGVWAFWRTTQQTTQARRAIPLLAGAAIAATFPLLQMLCFGLTDYRRPADGVLVLGARTYADGTPSDALADRVYEACGLYHAGLATKLIMSGGPGDGPIDEPEAMSTLAQHLGVSPEDIILDHAGVNTTASIRNAEALCRDQGFTRLLAVSHFYHLPRIKLESTRRGMLVYTVPAGQRQPLRSLPWFMARETAAWWWHFARLT